MLYCFCFPPPITFQLLKRLYCLAFAFSLLQSHLFLSLTHNAQLSPTDHSLSTSTRPLPVTTIVATMKLDNHELPSVSLPSPSRPEKHCFLEYNFWHIVLANHCVIHCNPIHSRPTFREERIGPLFPRSTCELGNDGWNIYHDEINEKTWPPQRPSNWTNILPSCNEVLSRLIP